MVDGFVGLGGIPYAIGRQLGRNLDYQVIPDRRVAHNTLFVYSPQGRLPFASLSWPGYIGVVTGVNRPDLSVNLLSVAARDVSWRGMPEGLINRLLLEISLCALA